MPCSETVGSIQLRIWLAASVPVLLAALPGAARAQGIDCTRARSNTEHAICASPALLALDHQVAVAYADAIARQPDRRDAMRTGLLAWLRARDTACNVPATAIERCLSGQLTARLAALAPPPQLAFQPPAAPPAASPLPIATPAPPPDPAIPAAAFNQPTPAATLDAATLPATAEAGTLLHVTSPGRFTLAAHSPSGATLQLVDMLTGPSETAGSAGSQDGRLDELLDVGTYKLRTTSAEGATGTVALTVTPFHDAAPPAALPNRNRPLATTLRDGEQRAFWLTVPPGNGATVQIEAAGRALGDLRLWRDGRDLTALTPDAVIITPASGHPLTDLRLAGNVEPGTYLAVAYGGPPLPWTDNDASQPFLLRTGARDDLAEGWAGGTIGPFGSERFTRPAAATILRLDLPTPAKAELRLGAAHGTIEKNNREPTVSLSVPSGTGDVVEVRAAAGQPYTLRAIESSSRTVWSRAGTWWMSAVAAGMGGDEVPPTYLLERTESYDKPPRILGGVAPNVAAGAPYHTRFNLRGRTELLLQTPNGGDVAFTSMGVEVRHGRSGRAAAPPGYLLLSMEPVAGALGSLDLVVGTPGTTPPPIATPLPADPVMPLGLQTLATGQSLRLDAGFSATASIGLSVRAAPVALSEGPLLATVAAGNSLSVPVAIAPGGTLSVTELGVGPIAAGQADNTEPGRTTVVIPVADHGRTVALSWHRTEAAPPRIADPPPPGQVATVTAGTPRFLDLGRGEERGFSLVVPEGGLFRLETLGRLHTAARVATPFIPQLATADGNGTGQNALIQSALRAGRYRVDVRAIESAGHLALLATPAPLLTGSTLVPGGSVRASLPGGSGVAFPITVTGPADGHYHLDLLSLGTPWVGRLEDAEGWPIVTPGRLDGTETALHPGHYRLVVTPDAVARQVVARLTPITKPTEITGHGPHALPFEGNPQQATWREPDSRDGPRPPDLWTFNLPGPAEITLTLSDGMVADLRHDDASIARITKQWTGTLQAGAYQVSATSLGRNDRLGYTLALSSPMLQPGATRSVTLPASLPFSLATASVANITTWGTLPVKAVLREDGGMVVARYNSRADDWNLAASRLLPPGKYQLDLQSAEPPAVSAPSGPYVPDTTPEESDTDDQAPQTKDTKGAGTPDKTVVTDATPDSDKPDSDKPEVTVAVSLTLPASLPPVPAPAPAQDAQLDGNGVHVLSLPQPDPNSLVVAAASATAPSILTLERASASGWQTVAIASGRSPVVAAPADADPAEWRVEAWTIDGGPEPIRLAARAITAPAQSGPASLTALDGMPIPLAAAHATLPASGIATTSGGPPGLLAGGWPGHALDRAGPAIVTSGPDLWLLAPQPGTVTITPVPFAPGEETVVQLPAGLAADLPVAGQLAIWRVAGATAQPSFGAASGLAPGSAVTLANSPATVRAPEAMRLRVIRDQPKLLPTQALDGALQTELPPGSALPLTLAPGDKTLQLDLAPGLAAFAGWHGPAPAATWSGTAAISRTADGAWTDLLLVNTGMVPAAAKIAAQPAPAAEPLKPGTMLKRFFGASGSLAVTFEAPPGTTLMVAGDATATAATDTATGTGTAIPVAGPGRATIQHGPGAVALWLDAPGTAAWPDPAAQAITLPARTALSGAATALTYTAGAPALLHVTTTTPVFAGLRQNGRTDPPALFAAGAELHRAVAAGPVTILLYSATDAPLGGTATVSAEPLIAVREGLGDAVALAPGGSAAFGFTLAKAVTIGVGLRAEPDRVAARLLDSHGAVVGEGVAQLRPLAAGAYVLEARVPPTAPTVILRPALVGITPRGNGPPPDVVQTYLELVGMKPQKAP